MFWHCDPYACPNAKWRLLVGLARYGGLRVPSEVVALRWGDIDWDKGTFTVTSSKTEHHEGKGERMVPLFPELLPLLQEAFDMAEEPVAQPGAFMGAFDQAGNVGQHEFVVIDENDAERRA